MSAVGVSDEYKLPKLNGDNYFVWSIRAKAALVSKKLWSAIIPGFVDQDGKELASLNANQQATNDSALAFLILIVSDEFVEDLGICTTAKEAWTTLEVMHTRFSLFHTTVLVLEYVNFHKDDDMTMHEYLSAKGELARKIQSGGIEFTDKQKAAFLLTGLPFPKYEGFVRSIEREGDTSVLSTTTIKAKLLLEEKRMKREDEMKDRTEVGKALIVHDNAQRFKFDQNYSLNKPTYKQGAIRRPDKGNIHKKVVCFACNETGHISRNCPRFSKEQNDCVHTVDYAEHNSEPKKGSAVVSNYMALRVVHGMCNRSHRRINGSSRSRWLVDSAASHHMSPHRRLFKTFEEATGSVSQADDSPLQVKGCGTIEVKLLDKYGGWTLRFSDVLYVPSMSDNLLSGRQLDKKGVTLVIKDGCIRAMNKNDEEVFKAFVDDTGSGMYVIETVNLCTQEINAAVRKTDAQVWHRRFGHMKRLPKIEVVGSVDSDGCEVCIQGKMKRKPFPASHSRANAVLDLVHSDVVCQIRPDSIGGARNFVTFTDDFSRYTDVVPIKKKSEVFEQFKNFQRRVELFQGKKIKALQTDGGGEYCNNDLENYLKERGIQHRVSAPYTPQQNGRSERVNQTLMNIVRCLLIQSGMPVKFWAEALNTACTLKNLCPSKAVDGAVPYELWFEKKLSEKELKCLKVFGCSAWYADLNKHKLGERAKEAVFLGYEEDMKVYRLWDTRDKKISFSRDVIFKEDVFPFKSNSTLINPAIEEEEVIFSVSEEGEGRQSGEGCGLAPPETVQQEKEEASSVNRPERIRRPKLCGCCNAVTCSRLEEPKTVDDALSRPDASEWIVAMEAEMSKLKENGCWKLVSRPKNANVIGSKWVLRTKKNERGDVERYKARLVAQGYSQVPGRDYDETYSPVVRMETVRLLTAVSVEKDWHKEHWDVTSAYQHSPLEEEVFMEQPSGFEEGEKGKYVWQLQKSLYGLHQASRDWNKFLDMHLKNYGLHQSKNDPCVYFDPNGELIVGVYVDDLPVWGERTKLNDLRNHLEERMEIRSLGQMSHLLSMGIREKDQGSLEVDQHRYVKALLREFRMDMAKGVTSPLELKSTEDETTAPFPENIYRRATGSLLYLASSTRPDLSHAVSRQCQYNSRPTIGRWKEVQHILRYLKHTENFCLTYEKQGKTLEAYVDADWGGDTKDRKSYSGLLIMLAGGAVAWASRKQSSVSHSTVEAEYISLSDGLKEVLWMKSMLEELGLDEFVGKPCSVYVDNQGAISLASDKITSRRSKHIDIKYHFVREKVENGEVCLKYVSTQENLADILTKPLTGIRTRELSKKMGLKECE